MLAALTALPVHTLRAQLHDLRDDWPMTLAGLALLVAATVLVSRRRSPARVAGWLVAALFWLAVDGTVEGPTLVHVVRRHGVTLGDLLPVAMAIVAVVAVAAGRHRKRVRAA